MIKKCILLMAIFGVLVTKSSGQNAYYNAQRIDKVIVGEIADWLPPNPNLINNYIDYGLLDKIDMPRLNNFDDLEAFIANPFVSGAIDINMSNLLYQLDVYEEVKVAIADNKEKKLQFFLKNLPIVDGTLSILGGGVCSDANISAAVYNNDATTYVELCSCLPAAAKRTGILNMDLDNPSETRSGGLIEGTDDIGEIFSSFGNISNVNLTSMLVDATAQFLVERVQKELSIAFFDKLRKEMDETPELKAFFPATFDLLKGLLDFKEPSLGKAWINAFRADMMDLPKNFETFVLASTEPFYVHLRAQAEFQYFRLGYHAAEKIIEGTNAADLLAYLDGLYNTEAIALPAGSPIEIIIRSAIFDALEISHVISKNIRYIGTDSTTSQVWIHPSELIKMDFRTKRFFVGLMWQENQGLISRIMGGVSDTEVSRFLNNTNSFLVICETIQKEHQKLLEIVQDTSKTKRDHFSAYLDYTEVAFQTIDFGFSLTPINQDYIEDYKPLTDGIINIIRSVHEKDYGQVFAYGLKVITKLIDVATFRETPYNAPRDKRLQQVLEHVAFYGGFVVDIISADSTMKMKKILRKYAAPVGSYKIKRNTKFSIDLNAYPGIYGGFELTPQGTTNDTKHGFVYGVTAPIGFSVNWGTSTALTSAPGNPSQMRQDFFQNVSGDWKEMTGASNSIFFGVVDIGAAVSYRWTGTGNTDEFPDSLRFEQIFSPSIHYVHGFRNAPVSLMVGVQYTPLLRSIKQNNVILDEFNAWRFGVTIAVDIPIFNLYRSRRSR